ncbi:MAG: hypothetical protein PVH63_02845 [Balneolaceae bacterium]|jgi:hypothetical protein
MILKYYSMVTALNIKSIVCSVFLAGFLCGIAFPIQAMYTTVKPVVSTANSTSRDSLRLTRAKVRDWINTRIAVAKLQKKMKANAAAYDDVVHAFYAKRKILLKSRGWSISLFDAVKERINAAAFAMDMADELAESKNDHEKEIADIKSNEYLSEEQKQKMIDGLQMMREQKRKQYIEPTKADWPAVTPYRATLKQLTHWYAGNIPNPPEVN